MQGLRERVETLATARLQCNYRNSFFNIISQFFWADLAYCMYVIQNYKL